MKNKVFKVIIIILCILLGVLLIAVGAFLSLRAMGKKQITETTVSTSDEMTGELDVEVEESGKYVVYNGRKYCYNDDNINILFMGIDKSISETSDGNIGGNGQADVLILMMLDTQTGELSLINIPRDSMTDVNLYNTEGQYLGVEWMQVCLAYAYGDGKEASCENTMEAVSRLMYGMPIHGYAAIDLDSISVLNDAVGGVTVEVLEDLSKSNWELQKGAVVTLDGNQAHTYVRARDWSEVDANLKRMERQKQYLNAFIQKAFAATREDINVPINLYNAALDYMVTDIGTSSVTYLASKVLDSGINSITNVTIPGENVMGDEYVEFVSDEQTLYEFILDTFYYDVTE